MRRSYALWIVMLVCLAGACGGPSSGGLSGKSASQVIALAKAAATKEGSFHFIDQTGTGKNEQILVGDSSADAGQQQVKGPNGDLEVRLVDSTIYVNGSELVLGSALRLTAAQATAYAGKWISLTRTDTPYQTVAKALLPSSELAAYLPVTNLKIGNVSTLRGHSVLAVSGNAPAVAGTKAIATLYISTASPNVPVGGSLVASASASAQSESEVVAFTAWGETVRPEVPGGATPYTTVQAG